MVEEFKRRAMHLVHHQAHVASGCPAALMETLDLGLVEGTFREPGPAFQTTHKDPERIGVGRQFFVRVPQLVQLDQKCVLLVCGSLFKTLDRRVLHVLGNISHQSGHFYVQDLVVGKEETFLKR